MVQTAGNHSIAGNGRRGLETVLRLRYFHITAAIALVQTIKIAIGRTEVDAITGNGGLAGPTVPPQGSLCRRPLIQPVSNCQTICSGPGCQGPVP